MTRYCYSMAGRFPFCRQVVPEVVRPDLNATAARVALGRMIEAMGGVPVLETLAWFWFRELDAEGFIVHPEASL